jgi:diadenosine tetraphosphate (Ap4A) HIT family hydrolase
MSYDNNNIFARILRKEIPCKTVLESDHGLAFHDIHPKAPVHVLVIPKGNYTDAFDFYSRAGEEEIMGFSRFLSEVIEVLGIKEQGYRLIANHGLYGGQEVPHFHMHILGGRSLGPMVS